MNERVGNNLTLNCQLSSSSTQSPAYDDQLTWGKSTSELSFRNVTDLETLAKNESTSLYTMVSQSDLNQAQKSFLPLKAEDQGTYFCGSLKYKIFEIIYIQVRDVGRLQTPNDQQLMRPSGLPGFCNEKMFKCKTYEGCIMPHYVCDRKPDCKDGSDESYETCKGDPCKDKLQCDDGRCIPMYWCCDRHHDLECNVTYPPTCCQLLSEPYEELEYGYVPVNLTQATGNGTRYIFISLCILATIFSIVLMLLILSKVFLIAKKNTPCRNSEMFQFEERDYHYRRSSCGYVRADREVPNEVTSGTVDALLILSDDIIRFGGDSNIANDESISERPPSYSDVMGGVEPPPPYTSLDCLELMEHPDQII